MNANRKRLIINLVIPLAVGGLSALLSGGMDAYKQLQHPPLSPPGWLFPIVWSILYLLMGYSAYRVQVSGKDSSKIRTATVFYALQLFVNFLWPLIFFGLGWLLTAFMTLVVLWILIYITMRLFSDLDELAGDLLLPYILWVTFAGYLNLGIFLLN